MSSFPSSAWERTFSKLRFVSRDRRSLHIEAKQSFAEIRPQAELGNEVSVELRPRDF
jgi:hypothetical protein